MPENFSKKNHELHDFMSQLTEDIRSEYERIQKRVLEDPGTAGDEGEENWAELLRKWLPSDYKVVTKGRILGYQGVASPQVDIIVLDPSYPEYLVNKKLYLAGGVIAAFECKLTLRPGHLKKAFKTASKIHQLVGDRHGSAFDELFSPILYGFLAHSHSWTNSKSRSPVFHLIGENNIACQEINHPRDALDLICVADLCTLSVNKLILPSRESSAENHSEIIQLGYNQWIPRNHLPEFIENDLDFPNPNPIGIMVYSLLSRLAWEDKNIRRLANYYRAILISGVGFSADSTWPLEILSDEVRTQLQNQEFTEKHWDKSSKIFMF